MNDVHFSIAFADCSVAEANRLGSDLKRFLEDTHPQVAATPQRTDPSHQSLGEILAMVLGAKAVVEVAKGIHAWLARNPSAEIEIHQEGKVIARNLRSKDARALAEFLAALPKSGGPPKP